MPLIEDIQNVKTTEVRKKNSDNPWDCNEATNQSTSSFIKDLQINNPGDWRRIQLFVNIVPLYILEINDSKVIINVNKDGIMIINHEQNQKIPVEKILPKEEMKKLITILCPVK